jgi:hypothetical protein
MPIKKKTATKRYLLRIHDDVEPEVLGPFRSALDRDKEALKIREMGAQDGLYPIDTLTDGDVDVWAYPAEFLDPSEEQLLMSRVYEMTVKISEYNSKKQKKIVAACMSEWPFRRGDFFEEAASVSAAGLMLTATAEGNLGCGDTEGEFAGKLAKKIWKANGSFCAVNIRATYLEELPCEEYEFLEYDYEAMTQLKPA